MAVQPEQDLERQLPMMTPLYQVPKVDADEMRPSQAVVLPEIIYKIAIVDVGEEISDPSPLGLFAFSIGTCLFSFLNLDITPSSFADMAIPIIMMHGGVVQMIAGLFEFQKKNGFASVTFLSYGALLTGLGIYYIILLTGSFADGFASAINSSGNAILQAVYAGFSCIILLLSFQIAWTVVGIFGSATMLFILGAAGGYSPHCKTASAAFGLLLVCFGVYTGFALMVNQAMGNYLIPVGRLGKTAEQAKKKE